MEPSPDAAGRTTPILTGVVAALVGSTSSFVVVVAGLRAVGADPREAASGLMVLCLLQGAGTIWLSWRYRMPLLLAWSTPGAALLVSAGAVAGGWPAAVGAFLVAGLLTLVTASWRRLGDLVAAIPASVAQAMLAGVLLVLCLQPVLGARESPAWVLPLIGVWLVLQRLATRWATPAAFAVALAMVLVDGGRAGTLPPVTVPTFAWTTPEFTPAALVGIAVPLYLVTMASQNLPGAAVLASYGFTVPWRAALGVTGVGSVLGAGVGGHAVNLAAITAALPASEQAHPDPGRRWIAAQAAGWSYIALAPAAPLLIGLVEQGPPGVFASVAGLALLGTLAGALTAAMREERERVAAAATLVVAASGVAVAGVGAAFWALVVGLVLRVALSPGPAPARHRRRAGRPARPTVG